MIRMIARILRLHVSTAVILALMLSSAISYAAPREIDEIRDVIKAKGARWHADETSVSRLSHEEKMKRLGLNEEDLAATGMDATSTAPIPTVTAAPATLDWRNLNGISYVTPVKNQGSCGSCWAFAVTAGLESQEMIGTGGLPIDLSEQTLVSCSGAGNCSGGSTTTASNFVRDTGLPVESCFSYTATNNSCPNACLNWQSDTYSITGWHRPNTNTITVDDIKNALYTYGPVIASMYVYNDFYSYRSGVYSYATGSYVGAHAVLVVGYDDVNQCFVVKNSWGTGWGEAGYFLIDYSEVTGTTKFGYSTLAYDGYGGNPAPPPTPTCTYSLSATGKNFKATGGNAGFSVSTQSGCSWSAVSSASWVTITAGADGSGNGAVSYSVASNTGSSRSAYIDVAGQKYNITQQGAKRH